MCTAINRSRGKPFNTSGCPVPVGNIICGETQTLNIINEFKRLYEEKMQEIDNSNCGDCLQEKLKLQQDWIGDLTEQNEMLVRAVEELEVEATERVKMLEDKLQKSAECICEVMKKYREMDTTNSILEEPRKRIFNLENDIKNLLEFIRRIREEQQWGTGGLIFYELTEKDLFGTKCEGEVVNGITKDTIRKLETRAMGTDNLSKELEAKREECESLQKSMIDMRQALTEEVASKHDMILKLKRECQELEERCIQADKQTAFRDDIIKELRKEIKQLKQQVTHMQLLKYKIGVSLEFFEQTIKENTLSDNSENFDKIKFVNELNEFTDVNDNLYGFMEKEIIDLNKIVDIKHNQLKDLFELNKILIQRLFFADNGLKFLEERAFSAQITELENETNLLKNKNQEIEERRVLIEKEKNELADKVNDAKSTILKLEAQFNGFLQDREQLRTKYRAAARQGNTLLEECKKMKAENTGLKAESDQLRSDFERSLQDKKVLEDRMKEFKEIFNRLMGTKDECIFKNKQLSDENGKLAKELNEVHEMNKSLLTIIANLKVQFKVGNKITHEEMNKLNRTIDVLGSTLEQGKLLHEEEERDTAAEISCLNNKLKEYERCISKLNQEMQEKNNSISCLNVQINDLDSNWKRHLKEKECEIKRVKCEIAKINCNFKELENLMYDRDQQLKSRNDEIVMSNKNIRGLETCICDLEKQLKGREAEIMLRKTEITKLNCKIKELENLMCNKDENLQSRIEEILILNNNLRELETCTCDLKKQLKVRIEENAVLKTKVTDQEECNKKLQNISRKYETVDVLKSKIKELESQINDVQYKSKLCKICKQNIRVTFRGDCEVQTDLPEPTEEQLQLLFDRDELIRYQTNTLETMQQELHNLHEREKDLLSKTEIVSNEKQILENKFTLLNDQLNEALKKVDLVTRKEEIIKKQKEAINLMHEELITLRKTEAEMRVTNESCCTTIEQLKNKINELERAVQDSEKRANNLQMAVDLYTNTINVLEASEEKYKLEMDHQRTTINNLQEMLVTTKHELDEFKQKYDESVSPTWTSWFGLSEPKSTNNNQKQQKPVHDI